MGQKIIIAIDGYSACGKSTTARAVAAEIGYKYIDTGAMYRAATLYFIEHHVTLTNPNDVHKALQNITVTFKVNEKTRSSDTYLNGLNVEKDIRNMKVSEKVSQVAAIPAVRHAMVEEQQKIGKDKGIVMDGRDIGTTVFPDAELKIFMTASLEVRAARRQDELFQKGNVVSLDEIKANLSERDHIDSTRKESPLTQAIDSHLLDTTSLSFDAQVHFILELYRQIVAE